MCGTFVEVQTVQQPGQFTALYVNDFGPIFRPLKPILFQSLVPQAEAVSVPIQNFNNVPLPVAETKQVPRQWIELQLLGNHDGQTID